MQTFLPYASFRKSAQALDDRRLGKQRVEALQLLMALSDTKLITDTDEWRLDPRPSKWSNHPAARMWSRHPHVLIKYGVEVCEEWIARGFNDTCLDKIHFFCSLYPPNRTVPKWLGHEPLHLSHQSNLIRKNEDFYGRQFRGVPDDLEYIWPIPKGDRGWTLRVGTK